jgi:hypothetical protein
MIQTNVTMILANIFNSFYFLLMHIEPIPLPKSDYLYHQLSQIANAGEGLFTAIKIFKHEIIAIFEREEIDEVGVQYMSAIPIASVRTMK